MSVSSDLPPSALFVAYVLDEQGSLSRASLLAETGLHERTLRSALERLRETDRVKVTSVPGDARQHMYTFVDT